MTVKVQAPFQVTETLQNLIDEKTNKLQHIFERITSVEIFLKVDADRHKHGNSKQVEVKLNVPRQTLFAEDHNEEFDRALIKAMDKMRKQLLKYKEQLVEHH